MNDAKEFFKPDMSLKERQNKMDLPYIKNKMSQLPLWKFCFITDEE